MQTDRVDFVFGLARNARLETQIETELAYARAEAEATGNAARSFRDFTWPTIDRWNRARRVVANAEYTQAAANPRFVVTSLTPDETEARHVYEAICCARGEMENRIHAAMASACPSEYAFVLAHARLR